MSQTNEKPDRRSTPGMPRWVKVFGIIAIILVLLFVILMLINPGDHGPGRHIPSNDAGDTPSVTLVAIHRRNTRRQHA